MTARRVTLPLDIILSISAFLSNPLDLLSLSQTCRSVFLASQAWASYWSKSVPAAHLSRPAPLHSYSPSELRDAHIRYAATHRRWESPSPVFKPSLRLPHPHGFDGYSTYSQRWLPIPGTRWAWSFQDSAGKAYFCDLKYGLFIGKWSTRGPMIDPFIESRSPNECVLFHLRTKQDDTTNKFEIVATSVTFEQENLTSPIRLSFRTIQKLPIGNEITLSHKSPCNPTVLWRDYLIGSFSSRGRLDNRPMWTINWRIYGLYIWSLAENSIFYFEMEFIPRVAKIFDDVLFVKLHIFVTDWTTAYCCLHIPSLVISTQLPGGSLSLTENAFNALLPKSIMQSHTTASRETLHTKIYSIPACTPTHPKYCFIIRRYQGQSEGVGWDVLEVEIDLRIRGPIKIFSRISQQYYVHRPTDLLLDADDNLLLYLPLGDGGLPRASLSVQFLRVGKPGEVRVARLGGVDKMSLFELSVDKDAGYVIIWAREDSPESYHGDSYIWWLDESKPDDMVYSRKKELKSTWSRRLLRGWKGSLCRILS